VTTWGSGAVIWSKREEADPLRMVSGVAVYRSEEAAIGLLGAFTIALFVAVLANRLSRSYRTRSRSVVLHLAAAAAHRAGLLAAPAAVRTFFRFGIASIPRPWTPRERKA
jgi:hypothetical protein